MTFTYCYALVFVYMSVMTLIVYILWRYALSDSKTELFPPVTIAYAFKHMKFYCVCLCVSIGNVLGKPLLMKPLVYFSAM